MKKDIINHILFPLNYQYEFMNVYIDLIISFLIKIVKLKLIYNQRINYY